MAAGVPPGLASCARQVEALFSEAWVEDLTRYSDGRFSTRQVERPRVSVDEWMNALDPGDTWLRVAPVDRGWRQERVRVGLPRSRELRSGTSLGKYDGNQRRGSAQVVPDESVEGAPAPPMPSEAQRTLPAVPPDCPEELVQKMGADILAKLERRWPRTASRDGAVPDMDRSAAAGGGGGRCMASTTPQRWQE